MEITKQRELVKAFNNFKLGLDPRGNPVNTFVVGIEAHLQGSAYVEAQRQAQNSTSAQEWRFRRYN
jgi:hypothetical protein